MINPATMARMIGKTYRTWPKPIARRESMKCPAIPAKLKKLSKDKPATTKRKIDKRPLPISGFRLMRARKGGRPRRGLDIIVLLRIL